jgi:hypothetical protein
MLEQHQHVRAAAPRPPRETVEKLHGIAIRREFFLPVVDAMCAQRVFASPARHGLAPLRSGVEVPQLNVAELMRQRGLELGRRQVAERARGDGEAELVGRMRTHRHVDSPELDHPQADGASPLPLTDGRGGYEGRQSLIDLGALGLARSPELGLGRRASCDDS